MSARHARPGKDIEDLERWLFTCQRLITLTGPAGVGKATLARLGVCTELVSPSRSHRRR